MLSGGDKWPRMVVDWCAGNAAIIGGSLSIGNGSPGTTKRVGEGEYCHCSALNTNLCVWLLVTISTVWRTWPNSENMTQREFFQRAREEIPVHPCTLTLYHYYRSTAAAECITPILLTTIRGTHISVECECRTHTFEERQWVKELGVLRRQLMHRQGQNSCWLAAAATAKRRGKNTSTQALCTRDNNQVEHINMDWMVSGSVCVCLCDNAATTTANHQGHSRRMVPPPPLEPRSIEMMMVLQFHLSDHHHCHHYDFICCQCVSCHSLTG